MSGKCSIRIALFVACLMAIWIAPSPQAQAAKPVEYVKVCSLYGEGFYYVPGTETCIRVGSFPTLREGTICGGYGRGSYYADGATCPTRAAGQRVYNCLGPIPGVYADTPKICGYIRTDAQWGSFQTADTRTQTEYGTLRTYTTVAGPLNFALMGGGLWTHTSSSYSSTGIQAPGSFSSNASGGDFYAQLKYSSQLGNGVSMSFGLNGGVNATGTMTLFDIVRHNTTSTNGHVIATLDPGAVVNPFVEIRAPITPGTYVWVAPGALFQEQKLSLSSDQTGFGGKLEQGSTSTWVTGFDLGAGISRTVCPNCFFNQPLTVSLGGHVTWFNSSQSVDLRSSAFGFTETAKLDSSTQYGATVKLTTPVSWGDRWRVHRDFGF